MTFNIFSITITMDLSARINFALAELNEGVPTHLANTTVSGSDSIGWLNSPSSSGGGEAGVLGVSFDLSVCVWVAELSNDPLREIWRPYLLIVLFPSIWKTNEALRMTISSLLSKDSTRKHRGTNIALQGRNFLCNWGILQECNRNNGIFIPYWAHSR